MIEYRASMNNINNLLILLGFPIFFITVWCLTLWLISQLSGWSRLAKTFAYREKFTGTTFSFQSARINWASFNNALKIGVSQEGLYLVPLLFFRFFFTPLLIPWSEINAQQVKKLFATYQRLTLESFPNYKIDITQATFDKIVSALEKESGVKIDSETEKESVI